MGLRGGCDNRPISLEARPRHPCRLRVDFCNYCSVANHPFGAVLAANVNTVRKLHAVRQVIVDRYEHLRLCNVRKACVDRAEHKRKASDKLVAPQSERGVPCVDHVVLRGGEVVRDDAGFARAERGDHLIP